VIGANIWEIKEKTITPVQAENGDFVVYTDKNYQTAQLTIEFENQIPENFTVQIQKDFSVFLEHRKKGVYSEEELKEKLFKNNPTQHPNGAFLKHQKDVYFMEEGRIRKLDTAKILNFFDLIPKQLPEITSEEFNQLFQDDPLTYQSIQENFPEDILIKKEDFFYITSDNGYNPIHIPNSEKLQKKLNLQLSTLSGKWEAGECFKTNNKTVNCNLNLNKRVSNYGNIYRIKINNNAQEVNNLKIKLENNFNPSEIINEIKELFLK
jgi:hypothetical protein